MGDLNLEKPDATKTIDLSRMATLTQGLKVLNPVSPLPGKNTLHLNTLDTMTRAWTITGLLPPATYQQVRQDLDEAGQTWHLNGDGQTRLIWGTEVGGVLDYDFNVAILNVTYRWTYRRSGTSLLRVVEFTITLQEVGVIGTLNP